MWVEGSPLHFIVYNGIQKSLVSQNVMKQLGLPTTPHPQSYTIRWLHQGQYIHVSKQFHIPYNIKPFTNEVLCDVSPLEVCDVLLGKPYLWKHHVVYDSRPHTIIISLGNNLYKIPKVAPPTSISLIYVNQCSRSFPRPGNFSSL